MRRNRLRRRSVCCSTNAVGQRCQACVHRLDCRKGQSRRFCGSKALQAHASESMMIDSTWAAQESMLDRVVTVTVSMSLHQ
mmetsp:Transcript_30106/g.47183  ORF Transcript_30106/g.47183 Transcript_30106/m.47183 type:complete len:81 (-) Transcript_30106:63-305(-)